MKDQEIIERLLEKPITIFEYKCKHSINIPKDFTQYKTALRARDLLIEALKEKSARISKFASHRHNWKDGKLDKIGHYDYIQHCADKNCNAVKAKRIVRLF